MDAVTGKRGGFGFGRGGIFRGGFGAHQARGRASMTQGVRPGVAPSVDTRRRGSVDTGLERKNPCAREVLKRQYSLADFVVGVGIGSATFRL